MKNKLLLSFSGGRTSAFMLYKVLNDESYKNKYDFKVVFANTGKEHECTLDFVQKVSEDLGVEIIWIESKHRKDNGDMITKKGWGVDFKIVNHKTASRNGEPFEEMLSCLGIPCSASPFCSDQLKRLPIEKYLKSIGWKKFYKAIGIRCDEIDRVNEKWREKKIVYPLVQDFPTDKKAIINWWKNYKFDLQIPENLGNCDNCWKKSFKILAKNTKDYPKSFEWWADMMNKYSSKSRNNDKKISFFRGAKTIKELFEMSDLSEEDINFLIKEHRLDGCSESCEVYK